MNKSACAVKRYSAMRHNLNRLYEPACTDHPDTGADSGPATVSITPVESMTTSPVSSAFPTGITWRLFSYSNGKGGTTNVIGDQPVTALFRTDGQVTGSSGCNQYTAMTNRRERP